MKLGSVLLSLLLLVLSVGCTKTPRPAVVVQAAPTEFLGVVFGQPIAAQRPGLTFTPITGYPNSAFVTGEGILGRCDGAHKHATLMLVAGKVEEILCTLPVAETADVLSGLKSKYGEPTSTNDDQFQPVYVWQLGGTKVILGSKIDGLQLLVDSAAGQAANAAAEKSNVDEYKKSF